MPPSSVTRNTAQPNRRGFSLFAMLMVVSVAAVVFGQVRYIHTVRWQEFTSSQSDVGLEVLAFALFISGVVGAGVGIYVSLQARRKWRMMLPAMAVGAISMPAAMLVVLIGINIPQLLLGGSVILTVLLMRYWRAKP